ncbi:hypothetical protein ACFY8S_01850 [Streptomyces hygroscopicus]|uniref:hypothetical protein n=1 Tax=Streptomyces hygroscopicus TaxID=1912 RepID=UPI0036B5157C
MAQVVGLTSDQLRQAGRGPAADLLDQLTTPPTPASAPQAPESNAQVEAIAALLASISPEARAEVLSRFHHPATSETDPADTSADVRRHRAG